MVQRFLHYGIALNRVDVLLSSVAVVLRGIVLPSVAAILAVAVYLASVVPVLVQAFAALAS